MPNWKKLITSGSAAILSNVTASSYTGSFTGSLNGTSSWAVSSSQAISSSRAVSSSYALSASYAPAGAAFPYTGSARVTGSLVVTGSITSTTDVTAAGNIEAQVNLKSMNQSGDEGGEIFLNAPATNTTIPNGVTIDVYQNRFRIFEQGGAANGYYLDMPSGGPGASTNLNPTGYTGIFTIPGNPPGQQNLDIQNGIIVNVF
jgi:hypothetical protein